MTGVRVALIAAVASNGVIGADGAMPWRLSTDLKRFKRITLGKPVVMGRRTWDSIGRPLPGRTNIVVTRQAGWRAEGAVVAADLEQALDLARDAALAAGVDEIMVIGGATIYAQTIERADRLYVTHVAVAPDGDAHFPAVDPAIWEVLEEEAFPAGPADSAATRFVAYRRISAT